MSNAGVITAIVLTVVTFFASRQFFNAVKRKRFLREASQDPSFLMDKITSQALTSARADDAVFLRKMPCGWAGNILALVKSDRSATNKIQWIFGVVSLTSIICGYFSTQWMPEIFFLIIVFLSPLIRINDLPPAVYNSAVEQLVQIARILYHWRKENEPECTAWVEQAHTLKPIYFFVGLVP